MKKILSGVMALTLLLSFALPALAASNSPPLTRLYSSPYHSEINWFMTTDSGDFAISSASSSLSRAGSTSVSASASTRTNQTAGSVGGTMYLQKWTGSAWSTVRSLPFTAYNASLGTGSATWSVDSGYYYRLYTFHTATLDGVTVSKATYTDALSF